MDLLRLTPFELQHQGSSLKDTRGTEAGTEMSGKKARGEGQISPRLKAGGGHYPFSEPSSHRATEPEDRGHI